MVEEDERPGHDSVTRTNTEIESRDAETPRKPAPPEDNPRTNTEIESRGAEPKDANRPPEKPDTPRG
jgi:hypothetical protein